MNTIRHLYARFLLLVAVALAVPCQAQNDFEIAKNVDIFVSILKELNAKYADEISPGDLTKTAIDAMLKSMDPYTVYYPESQIEEFKMMTTGQYGGIGALIQQQGDYVLISEPYEGSPAQLAGLIAGDKILKINGQSTKGKTSSDVSTILKGQPGTEVEIEVERLGESKPMTFSVKRKEIKLPNLPYYGMLDDHIGYIKLDQFTENAGKEVRDAFLKLKEQGMTSLVFDLRNNGGGLLHEAVNIMNIFVDQNTVIAETRGKIKSQQALHKTLNAVTDKQIPVVVLVNGYSASASEIVSGALQDLDRAVIVGERTYGKGLVQATYPLPYDGQLKVTTSKYYIPSGRCIQARVYDMADSENESEIPDSQTSEFKTRHGRIVRDGRGISPDVCVKSDTIPMIMYYIIEHNLAFDYATEYRLAHDSIAPIGQFDFNDFEYEKFKAYVLASGHPYLSNSEKYLDELIDVAKYEKRYEAAANEFEALRRALHPDLSADLGNDSKYVKMYLSSEILERYYPQGAVAGTIPFDQVLQEAQKILLDTKRYKEILTK